MTLLCSVPLCGYVAPCDSKDIKESRCTTCAAAFFILFSAFPNFCSALFSLLSFYDLPTTYYVYTVWQRVEVLPDIAAVECIDALCYCFVALNAFDAGSGVVDIVKGDDAGGSVVSDVAEGLVGIFVTAVSSLIPVPVGTVMIVAKLCDVQRL